MPPDLKDEVNNVNFIMIFKIIIPNEVNILTLLLIDVGFFTPFGIIRTRKRRKENMEKGSVIFTIVCVVVFVTLSALCCALKVTAASHEAARNYAGFLTGRME